MEEGHFDPKDFARFVVNGAQAVFSDRVKSGEILPLETVESLSTKTITVGLDFQRCNWPESRQYECYQY